MSAVRAVGLLSGGLDSALAAKLLIDQGIEVIGLHLESPTACRTDARAVANELGIRLEVRAKGEEYVRLLRSPRFGYGRNMNPCVDCRIFMFHLGRPYLEEFAAGFLFTGEVLGQRPMSQTREAMTRIDRESGLEGWILRPLSARLLPVSRPESLEWVDRAKLLDIRGRGRLVQLELARRFGLTSHQSPGGGCLLTDPFFSRKVRDLFEHSQERAAVEDLELLRVGRHFRIRADLKIVLGRDAEENRRLLAFEGPERWPIEPVGWSGPTALVCGPCDDASMDAAVALIARHARDPGPDDEVKWRSNGRSGAFLGARASGERVRPRSAARVAVRSAVARLEGAPRHG